MASKAWRAVAPTSLMVASGFAGLGYQIVWTQLSTLWLGHESAAVLAVVAAFFGGLALGALALGARIEQSRKPVNWYVGCELVIAGWSALFTLVAPAFSQGMLRLTGTAPTLAWQWLVAFSGTFLLLLPATAGMGATLPAMERITWRIGREGGQLATLYAANTLGAVLGVLGTAFFLIPRWGLSQTTWVCAGLNLLCAGAAWHAFRQAESAASKAPASNPTRARRALVRLGVTGLLGIGYEVLVVRVLSQVTESTVYTFALLLAVYLVGSAAGAAGYERWLAPRQRQKDLTDSLLGWLAAACLFGVASLWGSEWLRAAVQGAAGPSVTAALAGELVPAVLAFGAPTLVMGALFSQLARRAQASGVGFARSLGVNTLAAAMAPALFGVLLAPALGPKLALLLVPAGYLALSARRSWRRAVVWLPAGASLLLASFAPPLAFIDVPEGGHVVSYEDGVTAAVSVVDGSDGVARLRINNRAQEGSSASQRVDGRQAWLPLLLHPAPRRALFLGLGTGVTAASAAEDTSLQVDAVELLPEVIRASSHFADSIDRAAYARLHLITADARRYVRTTEQRYDVIVADNYHPARSGSGSLYTVEHFRAVQGKLTADGVFCQWLPLHQLDLATLRSILRSFLVVYPDAKALVASYSLETPVLGLIGSARPSRFDPVLLQARLGRLPLRERVFGIGLEDELAVLGAFIAGPPALERLAASATANTDNEPVVAYRAPRETYAPDSSPQGRFLELLGAVSIAPNQVLTEGSAPGFGARLAAYWTARDRFIWSGRNVRASPRVDEMLAQVREPLLSVLRLSPDFRPAYDPLVAMAAAQARSNVSGARSLLDELTRLQPARPEAPRLLQALTER